MRTRDYLRFDRKFHLKQLRHYPHWSCIAGPAVAADVAKVGKCLLGNCQVVLAKCLADGECVENLICLQLCNGRPDETACQVISLAAGLVLMHCFNPRSYPSAAVNRCHYFAISKSWRGASAGPGIMRRFPAPNAECTSGHFSLRGLS